MGGLLAGTVVLCREADSVGGISAEEGPVERDTSKGNSFGGASPEGSPTEWPRTEDSSFDEGRLKVLTVE